jgi:hypothetical protein
VKYVVDTTHTNARVDAQPEPSAKAAGAPDTEIKNACVRLARYLFEEMEFLDPGTDELRWETRRMMRWLSRQTIESRLRQNSAIVHL